ncbi:hypothetical protein J6590_051870 [Homalodisca vitripennis]|nr:hypothetical protein J6590_051870 [Homalodisca vitripennis]
MYQYSREEELLFIGERFNTKALKRKEQHDKNETLIRLLIRSCPRPSNTLTRACALDTSLCTNSCNNSRSRRYLWVTDEPVKVVVTRSRTTVPPVSVSRLYRRPTSYRSRRITPRQPYNSFKRVFTTAELPIASWTSLNLRPKLLRAERFKRNLPYKTAVFALIMLFPRDRRVGEKSSLSQLKTLLLRHDVFPLKYGITRNIERLDTVENEIKGVTAVLYVADDSNDRLTEWVSCIFVNKIKRADILRWLPVLELVLNEKDKEAHRRSGFGAPHD